MEHYPEAWNILMFYYYYYLMIWYNGGRKENDVLGWAEVQINRKTIKSQAIYR